MKTLVVYFSFTGNNRLLAEHLAKRLDADLLPIVELKRRTLFTIFLDMMFRREPKIEAIDRKLSDYDHKVLVAPIWGSKLATPMRTLIKKERAALGTYSFISLCGYGRPEQHENITQELTSLAGNAPKSVTELRIRDLFPPEKQDVRAISAYRAKSEDLAAFEAPIASFLKSIRGSD